MTLSSPKSTSLYFCLLSLVRTVMLPQSTDSGQLITAAVIKLFHAMKLQVQDLRGVGIQVQLLEGHTRQDSAGLRTRSIKDMLLEHGSGGKANNRGRCEDSPFCFFFSCLTCQQSKSGCSFLLQMLLTCSRRRLLHPRPRRLIFSPLRSRSRARAETCRHSDKLRNTLGNSST